MEKREFARLYEVVLREGYTRDDLMAALDANALELHKDYEALPRNFRLIAEEGVTQEQAHAILEAMECIEGSGDKGDEITVKAAAETTPFQIKTVLQRPIDQRRNDIVGLPRSLDGEGLDWTPAYRAGWHIARVCGLDASVDNIEAESNRTLEYTVRSVGNGVDYYVLDTGVDVNHPEFNEDQYGTRAQLISDTFYQVNTDDQNHGTGMATCGVGRTMGIARNTRIIAAKGLDGVNSGTNTAIIDSMNALVLFYQNDTTLRPGVMNNSWSTTSSTTYTAAKNAAIDAGLMMVASAGNSRNTTAEYPAYYTDVLSVAAMDIGDRRSFFSTYNSRVNVCAPGREIIQGWRGGTFAWGDGTSPAGGMATAIVCCFLQGYSKFTSRTQVENFISWIETDGYGSVDNVATGMNGNATRMLWLGNRGNPDIPRIPGVNNRIAPWANGIRSDSIHRNVNSFVSEIGPEVTQTKTWDERYYKELIAENTRVIDVDGTILEPGQGEDDSVVGTGAQGNQIVEGGDGEVISDPVLRRPGGLFSRRFRTGDNSESPADGFVLPTAPVTDKGLSGLNTWNVNNNGFAETGTDLRELGNVYDIDSDDGQSDSQLPPGRPDADRAYSGSTNASDSRMYRVQPLRMTEDSNPVYLTNFFDNFEFTDTALGDWVASGSGTPSFVTDRNTLFPYSSLNMFEGTGSADSQLTQTKDIPATVSTVKIDAGEMYLYFESWHSNTNSATIDGDATRVTVEALAANDSVLGTIYDTGNKVATTNIGTWTDPGPYRDEVLLPATTRKLRITLYAVHASGTVINSTISGLLGILYEKTTEGDRIIEHVDKGSSGFEFNTLSRSFDIQADDRGRHELICRRLGNDSLENPATLSSFQSVWYSPYKWTRLTSRIDIPEGTRVIEIAIAFNRRAGSLINFYARDMSWFVTYGTIPRRVGSANNHVSGEPRVLVSTSTTPELERSTAAFLMVANSTTIEDYGTFENNITRNGGIGVVYNNPNYPNGAVYFDGTDDYLSCNDSEAWALTSGIFTIDFDLEFETTPTTRTWIAGQGGPGAGTGNFGWALWIESGTFEFKFTTWASNSGAGAVDRDTGITPSAGQRYRIRIDDDGSNMRVYVDGVMRVSTTSPTIADAASTFSIGQRGPSYNTNWFNGWIGGMRIINDVALTASDSGYDFNDGSTPSMDSSLFLGPPFRPSGLWTWVNHPRGLDIGGDTIVGAISNDGFLQVSNMDEQFTTDLRLGVFDVNDHANPSLLHRSDGSIMAFASAHNGSGFFTYTSSLIDDVSSWNPEINIDSQLGLDTYSYSQAFQMGDEANDPVYIFFRANPTARDYYYSRTDSTSSYATWDSGTELFSNSGNGIWAPYVIGVKKNESRIDFVLTDGSPNSETTNSVYHIYYESGSFHDTGGSILTLPITPNTDLIPLYDGTTNRAWIWDISFAPDGNPAVLYSTFPSTTDHRYNRAVYNGSSWVSTEIVAAGGSLYSGEPYYSGGMCFGPGTIDTVYASVEDISNVYQINEATFSGSWSLTELTSGSDPSLRPFVPVGSTDVVYFTGRYTTFTDYETYINRISTT